MGQSDMYNVCKQYHGKMVCITDKQGKRHVGRITNVDQKMVYIQPRGGFGGYGFGYWGGYGGWGRPGFGYGIALGAIAGIALAGAFFW